MIVTYYLFVYVCVCIYIYICVCEITEIIAKNTLLLIRQTFRYSRPSGLRKSRLSQTCAVRGQRCWKGQRCWIGSMGFPSRFIPLRQSIEIMHMFFQMLGITLFRFNEFVCYRIGQLIWYFCKIMTIYHEIDRYCTLFQTNQRPLQRTSVTKLVNDDL